MKSHLSIWRKSLFDGWSVTIINVEFNFTIEFVEDIVCKHSLIIKSRNIESVWNSRIWVKSEVQLIDLSKQSRCWSTGVFPCIVFRLGGFGVATNISLSNWNKSFSWGGNLGVEVSSIELSSFDLSWLIGTGRGCVDVFLISTAAHLIGFKLKNIYTQLFIEKRFYLYEIYRFAFISYSILIYFQAIKVFISWIFSSSWSFLKVL